MQKFLFDEPTLTDKDYNNEALDLIQVLKSQGIEAILTARTKINFIEEFYKISVKNFKKSNEPFWLNGSHL